MPELPWIRHTKVDRTLMRSRIRGESTYSSTRSSHIRPIGHLSASTPARRSRSTPRGFRPSTRSAGRTARSAPCCTCRRRSPKHPAARHTPTDRGAWERSPPSPVISRHSNRRPPARTALGTGPLLGRTDPSTASRRGPGAAPPAPVAASRGSPLPPSSRCPRSSHRVRALGLFFGPTFEVCPKVLPGVRPSERSGVLVPPTEEPSDPLLSFRAIPEVPRGERLFRQDRQEELLLVHPARMYRGVDRACLMERRRQPGPEGLRVMGGSIVRDPEHARGAGIRLLLHHLGDERPEGLGGVALRERSEHPPVTHIERSLETKRPFPRVLELHFAGFLGPRSSCGHLPAKDLDPGLLIRADHLVSRTQRAPLPVTLVEVENGSGLLEEVRRPFVDPRAVEPRSDAVLMEHAPQRAPAGQRVQSLLSKDRVDLGEGESAQR